MEVVVRVSLQEINVSLCVPKSNGNMFVSVNNMHSCAHAHLHSCASARVSTVYFQRAAPERSLCVTAVAVCCLCPCVTVIQTAMTKQMRQTAAINTKVRACRQS